jgi:oxaloacetate decarboxylase alpha subunit
MGSLPRNKLIKGAPMTTNGEKNEGPKPEKKKRTSTGPAKKTKVNPKLAIVQDVIQLMNEAQISELSFEQGGVKVHLRRGPGTPFENMAPTLAMPVGSVPNPAQAVPAASAPAASPAVKTDSTVTVNSPMVGTFYRANAPDAKPFAEEGGKIEAGQVYCIIEAMKLMNEVKSEVSGRIVKILVQNGQAVEFNQPLIVIEPS